MEKKIILDPKDFQEIIQYIHQMPVPFAKVEQAMRVKMILANAPIHEVMNKPEGDKQNEEKDETLSPAANGKKEGS